MASLLAHQPSLGPQGTPLSERGWMCVGLPGGGLCMMYMRRPCGSQACSDKPWPIRALPGLMHCACDICASICHDACAWPLQLWLRVRFRTHGLHVQPSAQHALTARRCVVGQCSNLQMLNTVAPPVTCRMSARTARGASNEFWVQMSSAWSLRVHTATQQKHSCSLAWHCSHHDSLQYPTSSMMPQPPRQARLPPPCHQAATQPSFCCHVAASLPPCHQHCAGGLPDTGAVLTITRLPPIATHCHSACRICQLTVMHHSSRDHIREFETI